MNLPDAKFKQRRLLFQRQLGVEGHQSGERVSRPVG